MTPERDVSAIARSREFGACVTRAASMSDKKHPKKEAVSTSDLRSGPTISGDIKGAVAGTVIVTGDRNVAIGSSGSIVGRDVIVTTHTDKRIISEDQAFERIGAAVKLNLDQLERNIAQARNELGQFFKLSLVFASLGFIVVIVGVALLLAGQIAAGVISTIASFIPEVTAALFFTKDRELRGTIERYHQHVLDSQRLLTMIDVAETVKDGQERDSLKREIIFKALGIHNTT